ncbi:hypothetical protein F511_20012 [Dorcoceras hygrometricum]|uniref:Uncharacterized protein n=1 Tax=Dorcoceras hygrometricum TaxID=472368 RepID=A0A2Z7DHB3_9LAMI|nr:hypothetical protein F511_20012 [Dorcoceras hygrometricum]
MQTRKVVSSSDSLKEETSIVSESSKEGKTYPKMILQRDSREGLKASARTPELGACSLVALALDDEGSADGEVLSPRVSR